MIGSWRSKIQIHTEPPQASPPVAPTNTRGMLAAEWRTLVMLPLIATRLPELADIPRGNGSMVIDVPGWKAPEASMAPLRQFLRWKGYNALGWGMGTNQGRTERDALQLAQKVEAIAAKAGRPIDLVGWSLGGVIAREAAREVPHAVRKVITFGTPVIGGPTYTLGARSYGARECLRISNLVEELDRTRPIKTPITAIFTRADRVVSWAACIDRSSLQVEHVEVRSTHLGMGLDPDVWAVIAERLAGCEA